VKKDTEEVHMIEICLHVIMAVVALIRHSIIVEDVLNVITLTPVIMHLTEEVEIIRHLLVNEIILHLAADVSSVGTIHHPVAAGTILLHPGITPLLVEIIRCQEVKETSIWLLVVMLPGIMMIILQVVLCMIVAHLGVQIMMLEDHLQEILVHQVALKVDEGVTRVLEAPIVILIMADVAVVQCRQEEHQEMMNEW